MTVFGSTAHLRDVKGEAIHASYLMYINFFGILDGLVTSSSTRNNPPGCAYIFWNITTKVIRQIMTMRK